MRPVLFHVGSFAVHSYGVMIAIAALMAGSVLRAELQRRTARADAAFPLLLAGVGGGFVGARVYFLVEHAGDVGAFSSFSGAGFTWYGGVLGLSQPQLFAAVFALSGVAVLAASRSVRPRARRPAGQIA